VADVRTLKLNLLADVSDFNRGINTADDQTGKLESSLRINGKKMAKSIALVTIAIGGMVAALAIDAAKAAADDEVSQAKFRESLKDSAGVTDDFVDSLDGVIEKMQFMSGFSDGQLRDGLSRLTRSTEDVTEAQDLLELSMDISRGTGKDLDTVVGNLAKAYDGNEGALKRMGVPLDDAILKSGDFKDITDELTRLFGGQASTYADTYQGKLDIVNQRLGELKESAGAVLLDPMKRLLEVVNDVAKGFAGETTESGLTGKVGMMQRELTTKTGGYTLGESLAVLATSFGNLFSALNDDKDADSTLNTIAGAMNNLADGINAVSDAYRESKSVFSDVKKTPIGQLLFGSWGPGGMFPGLLNPKAPAARAAGGPVMAGGAYRVGEFGPEMFVPSGSGSIRPDSGGQGVTIIMNGVIDGESARRSIERLLQDSSRRTGAINLVGATL
jgi:hypothetical protein